MPLAVLGMAACSGWPLYVDLPEPDDDAMEAPADPRSLIELDWVAADEPAETDDPTRITPMEVHFDDATVFSGGLDGLGWYDDAIPREFSNPSCTATTGARTPFDRGDYLGDADYHVLAVLDDAQLCAEVRVSDETVGWALLLVELDECGIPVGFATSGEDLLGYGLGGPGGGWGALVESGTRYAVMLAGYYPNDLGLRVDYELGLSLVRAPASGDLGLCPLLPEDGGAE